MFCKISYLNFLFLANFPTDVSFKFIKRDQQFSYPNDCIHSYRHFVYSTEIVSFNLLFLVFLLFCFIGSSLILRYKRHKAIVGHSSASELSTSDPTIRPRIDTYLRFVSEARKNYFLVFRNQTKISCFHFRVLGFY